MEKLEERLVPHLSSVRCPSATDREQMEASRATQT